MIRDDQTIKRDRMRYTKDTLSSRLVLLAIVLDALYFVSIYKSDVGSYYYSWVIGASIIYNLLFMLAAFLASEGVKSRKKGYTPALIVLGLMQFARVFYLPERAHSATISIKGEELAVMGDGQYLFVVVCLGLSAVCCIAAAVISYLNNKKLSEYLQSIETEAA